MQVDVFTIFPEAIKSYLEIGLLGKSITNGIVKVRVHDLRSFASDPRKSVDDAPYGGGPGMVLKCEPIFKAVSYAESTGMKRPLLLTAASGRLFDQNLARELSQSEGFSLLCGRYEGVDERIVTLVDQEVSIGDYVLLGGELAALVIIEAVVRLLPGVVGNRDSLKEESYSEPLLEYPQYTRPVNFQGLKVPDVLISGNHQAIELWKRQQALLKTAARRPDLLKKAKLSLADMQFLEKHGYYIQQKDFGEKNEQD